MILKSKLLQKGLVFFSIPLMVAFSFIIFLNNTLKESQRELEVQLHAKQALTNANSLLTDYTEAAVSVGIYGISREPNFRRRYEYWVPLVRQDLASLRSLFQGDGSKTEALERLTNLVNNGLAELDGSMESIDDNRVDVSTHRGTVSYKRLTRIRDLLRSTINTLIEDAKKIEEQGKEKRESMSRRLDNVLRWGVILNAWAAFFLIAFFIRGISRRLGVMTDNTMRLAAGRTLNQPIGGDDEIGQLDRVFHQMATALEEAARKERAVINYAADVICSVDSYGAFTAVSPACTSTWGYSPEDLLGRRLIDIVEPGDSAHTSQVLDDVKRQAGTVTFDNRTRRADGAVVNILWSVQWSAAEQSIFCVAHDITERKLGAMPFS